MDAILHGVLVDFSVKQRSNKLFFNFSFILIFSTSRIRF